MPRPKILVFQHVPYEPLGTLDSLLKESGFRIRYVNFGRNPRLRPSLDRYAALIVLGGALGGTVSRNTIREIGWYDVDLTSAGADDPVLSAFAPRQQVFQWHEDGIGLPPGAELLASSPVSDVQAFRHGEHAYGFQFHLEVDRSLIERWLAVPENRIVLAEERGRVDPAVIIAETAERIDALQSLSRQTFSRWIARFDVSPRRLKLPSR
jgi:GMP synthase (glutamine-hydrolysing)